MTAETINVVTDIDDVLGETAPRILAQIEQTTSRHINPLDFSEDIPAMLGMPLPEANDWWEDFCLQHFPEIEPLKGSQEVTKHVSSFAIIDCLTSRRPDFESITTEWVRGCFPDIRAVRHAQIPWLTDPQAHKRTKFDDLREMRPDVYWDDRPKHCFASHKLKIFTVLVDNYGRNRDIELPPGIVYAQNMDMAAELTEEFAALRAT